MTILEQIWYDKLTPLPPRNTSDRRYSKLLDISGESEKKLLQLLTEEGKELFKKYTDAQSELCDVSERDVFINGFRTGAKLMLEILENDKKGE